MDTFIRAYIYPPGENRQDFDISNKGIKSIYVDRTARGTYVGIAFTAGGNTEYWNMPFIVER